MKVTEHVEHLLRKGYKPKELVELGFPKRVVSRVRRQLKEEKASPQRKVPEAIAQVKTHVESLPGSPENIAATAISDRHPAKSRWTGRFNSFSRETCDELPMPYL